MGKKIRHDIPLPPDVEQAMVGFKPRFGSDTDIAIINALGDIKNLLTLEEGARSRRSELNKIEKESPVRRKAIDKSQAQILWLLKERVKEIEAGDN